MDSLLVLAIVVLLVAAVIIGQTISDKATEKRFREKLKKNYGSFSRVDFDPDRIKKVKGYFFKHLDDSEFVVDDITWSDLEGEALFASMNKCYSSTGEEVLYHILRTPDVRGDIAKKNDFLKKIDILHEENEERLDLQIIFATLGKIGKYSVYDYIELLSNIKKINLLLFIAVWIIYVGIASLFFVNPAVAGFSLAGFAIVCLFFSLSKKRTVERYVTSFEYIVRTVITTDKIIKMNPKGFEEEVKRLKELRKELKGIKPSYLVLIKQSSRTGAVDMAGALMSLINAFLLLDLFCFYRMLDEVTAKTDKYDEMYGIIGKMEAMISVSNFRASFDNVCVPEYTDKNYMAAKDIVHPLIDGCVDNSFEIARGMVITGSNASGKSTFLRTVLVNCLLSETIYTATAKEFKLKPSYIFSSLSLKDSLAENESYYMAEINSIKRVMCARDEGKNIICFLDEVLRGTNTIDRIAAATEILNNLTGDTILTFAATHDIELTYLLEKLYDNYFFREEILTANGKEDIYFSYKINVGRSDTRNALQLLRIMGYPPQVVDDAESLAREFTDTGKWRVL